MSSLFARRLNNSDEARAKAEDAACERKEFAGQSALPPGVAGCATGPELVHLRRERVPKSHVHGSEPIARWLECSTDQLSTLALDRQLKGADLPRALFLDTETTGLSIHGGSLPFLVGLGAFRGEQFVVEQLFLRCPSEEGSMLRYLASRLSEASLLVSFNGKSFDLPLLRARFIANRIRMPKLPPHLDVLHFGRRIYKRRLQQVRLTRLEASVLGFRRQGDVPGEAIPAMYFDFLHRGVAQPLASVFQHNSWDLLALPALVARIGRHFQQVRAGDAPEDLLAYASVAERGKDHRRARDFSEAAADRSCNQELQLEALLLEARSHRRLGDSGREYAALQKAEESEQPGTGAQRAEVHLALAKCLEHRFADYASALIHALQTAEAEGQALSVQRVTRLKRRLHRAIVRDRRDRANRSCSELKISRSRTGHWVSFEPVPWSGTC